MEVHHFPHLEDLFDLLNTDKNQEISLINFDSTFSTKVKDHK